MKKANVIVLAGQSNAVGCSEVDYLPKHFAAERIKKWRDGYENVKINYYSHDKKSKGFVKTTFNCTVLTDNTFGPEVGMAEALDERYPGEEFFIVKCAFGGVSLARDFLSPSGGREYDPLAYADQKENITGYLGTGEPLRAGWCYNELVRLLDESLALLEASGYSPEIKAFCWMQGESDALDAEATARYARNYDALVRDFGARFPGYADKCVFIDAGISAVWERYEKINEVKRKYAEKRSRCRFVDTIAAGLTTLNEPYGEPDIGHYDSESGIRLGRLFGIRIDI